MTDVKDPVCGMTITGEDTSFTSSYKGINYNFCSAKCKREFDEDPETVLAMKTARDKTIENERSTSLEKMIDEVAHEVRNPLTAIGGFARKVYKRMSQNDPNKEYMNLIIKDVDRLENIIREIIKLTTFGMPDTEPANINNIIYDAVKLFDKELENKRVKIKLELMKKPPVMNLDSKRITTAIANLIRNAVEAIETTPKLLKISTRVRGENMEIEVSDTGKGIPDDKIKYIFDPLFTSKIYGSGLGLTFTKMIIQEHGGTISAESESGKGAAFTIRLPLKSS